MTDCAQKLGCLGLCDLELLKGFAVLCHFSEIFVASFYVSGYPLMGRIIASKPSEFEVTFSEDGIEYFGRYLARATRSLLEPGKPQ